MILTPKHLMFVSRQTNFMFVLNAQQVDFRADRPGSPPRPPARRSIVRSLRPSPPRARTAHASGRPHPRAPDTAAPPYPPNPPTYRPSNAYLTGVAVGTAPMLLILSPRGCEQAATAGDLRFPPSYPKNREHNQAWPENQRAGQASCARERPPSHASGS